MLSKLHVKIIKTYLSVTRLWLAALHYNENSKRAQAVKKDGTGRNRIVFPKYKVGGHTLRRIPTESTFGGYLYTHNYDIH